jgi:hypothetical protein
MYLLMPRYQGIVAQDCVKVLIDEDNDDGASNKSWKMHGLFARLAEKTFRSHPMVHQA